MAIQEIKYNLILFKVFLKAIRFPGLVSPNFGWVAKNYTVEEKNMN